MVLKRFFKVNIKKIVCLFIIILIFATSCTKNKNNEKSVFILQNNEIVELNYKTLKKIKKVNTLSNSAIDFELDDKNYYLSDIGISEFGSSNKYFIVINRENNNVKKFIVNDATHVLIKNNNFIYGLNSLTNNITFCYNKSKNNLESSKQRNITFGGFYKDKIVGSSDNLIYLFDSDLKNKKEIIRLNKSPSYVFANYIPNLKNSYCAILFKDGLSKLDINNKKIIPLSKKKYFYIINSNKYIYSFRKNKNKTIIDVYKKYNQEKPSQIILEDNPSTFSMNENLIVLTFGYNKNNKKIALINNKKAELIKYITLQNYSDTMTLDNKNILVGASEFFYVVNSKIKKLKMDDIISKISTLSQYNNSSYLMIPNN